MSKTDKKQRINDALEILCTQADRDHIKAVNGRNESSELFRSWMDVSDYSPYALFFLLTFMF